MKLNIKGIRDLRKHILKLLEDVPEGKRIKLDNDLLDDLIFFKGKNQQGEVIKVPIWTGPFLRKLDLSKLSFKNVFFGIGDEIYSFTNKNIREIMDAEPEKRFKRLENCRVVDFVPPMPGATMSEHMQNIIDFSYTNIKVNFNEIYGDAIECTNFEGVDLSKSNASSLKWAYRCNFSQTNLKLDFSINDNELGLNDCDFSLNNFEGQTLDAVLLCSNNDECYSNGINNCIFWNTRLSITSLTDESKPIVAKLIKNDNLNGCYVNGVYIKNKKGREDAATQKYNEYMAYQESIKSKIEDQIRKLKK